MKRKSCGDSRPRLSGGAQLRCVRGPQTRFIRTLRFPVPMLDPKVFLKLLQLDLSAHPPGAPIIKIHLSAEPARPRSAQGGLFLPPSPEPEKLELTLARIAGMVGEQKVGALELLDTHHPEGFRMRRFVAEVARKVPQKRTPDTEEAQSARNRLASIPAAVARQRTLENGQPARVSCARRKEVPGRSALESRPLALLRRLVGPRSLVPRRMGSRAHQWRSGFLLPPGA